MLDIRFRRLSPLQTLLSEQGEQRGVRAKSPSERVRLLLVRDLFRLGWEMSVNRNRVLIKPPDCYDKQVIRESMKAKRQELLISNAAWIRDNLELARQNLGDGITVWRSRIEPHIEVCETQAQLDLFRILRFHWSSPYSEYVGRRIKLIIRDYALPQRPVIGIAALGSSIVHIPERDEWVGWDKETRTKNLIYAMDAYVLGALPPYNELLGGKLVSYIVASNEVRDIYERKYRGQVTNISRRTANRLACIFTTSLYGKSSQYNRVKYQGKLLYVPVGETKGYGTLHLTNETFSAMRELVETLDIPVTNRFGDGPLWRMRVIRTAAEELGFDADFLLRHSFRRAIYAVPLAHNCREFLKSEQSRLSRCDFPLQELVDHWRDRWLSVRKQNSEAQMRVCSFRPVVFRII